MRPLRKSGKKSAEMNLTPLIDVIFMLLLFFILTSTFVKPSISLNLPEASNREKLKKTDIVISVDRGGHVYVNREHVPLEELASHLSVKIGEIPDKEQKRVIFHGDENVPYKYFVKIVDLVKHSGAGVINIAHEEE